MGVYVFTSLHLSLIKVGHYSRANAWSRVAHRGFHSCLCPRELGGRVDLPDLELLYWFPDLTPKDEKRIHKLLADFAVIGEWFREDALTVIQHFNYVNVSCDRVAACATRRRL